MLINLLSKQYCMLYLFLILLCNAYAYGEAMPSYIIGEVHPKIPILGSTILIMPLNIQGAAESPIRLIGLIDKKEQKMQAENTNLSSSSREIIIGKIYKHYSGKTYKVIGIAHDSENPSLMRVIYQGLYDCATFGPNPVWDRPYPMFAEKVTINGKEQYRFEEVGE